MKKSDTHIKAVCYDGFDLACSWECYGPRSYIEADRHTSQTGHRTTVVERTYTEFFKPAEQDHELHEEPSV